MEDSEVAAVIGFSIMFLFILVAFLAIPVNGNLGGIPISLPLIGWIGISALIVLVLVIAILSAINHR